MKPHPDHAKAVQARVLLAEWFDTQAAKHGAQRSFRDLHAHLNVLLQDIYLHHDIPGVRYWQPPGVTQPFATAPGQMHHRTDVVELTRDEFLGRYDNDL